MSKISIIIPVYNVEKYLRETLDSLINQTFRDWSAICVDDGSPDNCGKILEEYANKDHRFFVIHQLNKGLSEARNASYPYIDSPYTMFLDSDDVLHNQCLEILYNNIEKSQSDILWFDSVRFQDDEMISQFLLSNDKEVKIFNNPFKIYAFKNKIFTRYNINMSAVVWNKIYKSEFVKQTSFAPGVSPAEDNLFTFEILAKIKKLAHLEENLHYYRIRKDSIMRSLDNNKIKTNLRKEIAWYPLMKERLLSQGVSPNIIKVFDKYFATKVFYKSVLKPFLQQKDIAQSSEYIDDIIKSGQIDLGQLKLRFKIVLFAYQYKFFKLGRLLSLF